jgi:hypothetical protein
MENEIYFNILNLFKGAHWNSDYIVPKSRIINAQVCKDLENDRGLIPGFNRNLS